jgi:hypothetical protein
MHHSRKQPFWERRYWEQQCWGLHCLLDGMRWLFFLVLLVQEQDFLDTSVVGMSNGSHNSSEKGRRSFVRTRAQPVRTYALSSQTCQSMRYLATP